jgi:hypothetical protein
MKGLSMEATTAAVLPAGDYVIIDPCYVYDGARWHGLVDLIYGPRASGTHGHTPPHEGIFTDPLTGCRFAYSGTATGDGTYPDQDGHLYGVDSGGLACLPLAMLDAATLAMLPARDHSVDQSCSGRLVTFATAWDCLPCDAQGVIRFGPIMIATGAPWEDEDE